MLVNPQLTHNAVLESGVWMDILLYSLQVYDRDSWNSHSGRQHVAVKAPEKTDYCAPIPIIVLRENQMNYKWLLPMITFPIM